MRVGKTWVGIIGVLVAHGASFVPFVLALALSCVRNRTDVPPYPCRLVDSVTVGEGLFDAQVLPNGKFVCVLDWGAEELSVVRTSDLHLVTQIPLNQEWWGDMPEAQVMSSPGSDYVYVTPYSYDYVGVVRTASQSVVDSLKLGEEIDVACSAISPDGRHIYVEVGADPSFVAVFRLPEDIVDDPISIPGDYPYITSMEVSPDGSWLYVIDIGDEGRVCAISLSDHVIEWQVSDEDLSEDPGALVVHPSGGLLYQLDEERVLVRESGTGLLVCNILVPSLRRADISPDGSYLYVTCTDSVGNGTVAVVQTSDNKVVRVIAMPDEVYDVAPSPDGQKLYVTGENGKLYVLSR
jgi:DNA-binding beta-propeller fold protein YncE